MSIKRYDLVGETDGNCNLNEARMESSDDGCYVKFRDYSELQSQITALTSQLESVVAENASRKSEVPLGAIENGRAFADRLEAYPFECQGGNLSMCSDWQDLISCFEHLAEWAMHGQDETPVTDAFLAEVRASGVDAAIEVAKNLVAQEFQYKDFDTAQRVCSKFPESDLVGKVEMVEWLAEFAAQLRQGGAV